MTPMRPAVDLARVGALTLLAALAIMWALPILLRMATTAP